MAGRIVTWKIVVAGEGGVGKTSTVVQACQSHFVDTYDPTLEDCHTRPLIVDGQPCVADFLDTAGEETYSALRDQWYRDADAIMILYSISSRSSFNRVKRFNDAILAARAQPQHPVRSGCKPLSPAGHDLWKIPPRILVGNKDDQEDTYREVSFQEGEALARELGIGFVESSATNAEKTMKPVHDLVQECRIWRDAIDNADSGAVVGEEDVVEAPKGSGRQRVGVLFKNILRKIKGSDSSSPRV